MSEETLSDHIKHRGTWMRGLNMVLFAVFYSIAEIVMAAVVIFQFLITLVSGRRNERLLALGAALARYVYEIIRYLTYNTERRPYPFSPWPDAEPPDMPVADPLKGPDNPNGAAE